KGNFPDRCSLQGARMQAGTDRSLVTQSMFWRVLLPEQKLEADRAHAFEREIVDIGPITHVRFNIIPDGGVNRLRLFGVPEERRPPPPPRVGVIAAFVQLAPIVWARAGGGCPRRQAW